MIPSPDVASLLDYFFVAKGDSDWRMVYNGTSWGLNARLWAPNFWLPNASSALRVLDHHVDLDLGEMFLNFPAHSSFQTVSGVDLGFFWYAPELLTAVPGAARQGERLFFKWNRTWMGSKPCPYWAVRFYYLAEEFCRGPSDDPDSPMRWGHIHLNLPEDSDYDPRLARVRKIDAKQNRVTGDLVVFVDNSRASGETAEAAWADHESSTWEHMTPHGSAAPHLNPQALGLEQSSHTPMESSQNQRPQSNGKRRRES
jgi:hypothetical protein